MKILQDKAAMWQTMTEDSERTIETICNNAMVTVSRSNPFLSSPFNCRLSRAISRAFLFWPSHRRTLTLFVVANVWKKAIRFCQPFSPPFSVIESFVYSSFFYSATVFYPTH